MPKKSAKSNPNILYTGLAIFVLACFFSLYKFYMPKAETASVNEVTSGSGPTATRYGEVPSVSIMVGNGSYTFAYGYGSGYNGGSTIPMDGVVIGNTFYAWSPVPYRDVKGFNPSKGVMYTTRDGKYTSYGSTVINHPNGVKYDLPGVATTSTTTTITAPTQTVTASPVAVNGSKLFYFNKTAKKCVPTSSYYNQTTQRTTDGYATLCSANLKKSLPGNTTGICYTTSEACMSASRNQMLGK